MTSSAPSLSIFRIAAALAVAASLQACGGDDDAIAPAPAAAPAPTVLAADDFRQGTGRWEVEQQDPTGTVTAKDGVLEIVQPAGATLWFKQKFSGDYEIRFTATPVPVTFPGTRFVDRISDLNAFWNATVPGAANPDPTAGAYDGTLAAYNALSLYYVGFGANGNSTTRLRRYDGSATRPQITGYATPESATADDKAGAMTAATRLVANEPTRIRIVSRAATAADPATLKWYANDQLVFSHADPEAYSEGWFAFRTTTSHWQLRDFSVVALPKS